MTHKANARRRPPDGKLETSCWCGRETKRIPATDVRAGRTFACSLRCLRIGERQGGREK